MTISLLTPESIEELKKSPYVANVSSKIVRFTEEFKELFWSKYQKGVAAEIILEQLGIDSKWLGESRVAGIRQHIKQQARQIDGFKDRRLNQTWRANSEGSEARTDYIFDVKKRLKKLEGTVAYMHQELEFIKKILLTGVEKK